MNNLLPPPEYLKRQITLERNHSFIEPTFWRSLLRFMQSLAEAFSNIFQLVFVLFCLIVAIGVYKGELRQNVDKFIQYFGKIPIEKQKGSEWAKEMVSRIEEENPSINDRFLLVLREIDLLEKENKTDRNFFKSILWRYTGIKYPALSLKILDDSSLNHSFKNYAKAISNFALNDYKASSELFSESFQNNPGKDSFWQKIIGSDEKTKSALLKFIDFEANLFKSLQKNDYLTKMPELSFTDNENHFYSIRRQNEILLNYKSLSKTNVEKLNKYIKDQKDRDKKESARWFYDRWWNGPAENILPPALEFETFTGLQDYNWHKDWLKKIGILK